MSDTAQEKGSLVNGITVVILVTILSCCVGVAAGMYVGSTAYLKQVIFSEGELDNNLIHVGSPGSINETFLDTNEDGQTDTWLLAVRPNQPYTAVYSFSDENGDGRPNVVSYSHETSVSRECMFMRPDRDQDGVFDADFCELNIQGHPDKYYIYADLNRDGVWDKAAHFENGAKLANYALADEAWFSVVDKAEDDPAIKYVRTPEGKNLWMTFDDEQGEWKEVDAPAS